MVVAGLYDGSVVVYNLQSGGSEPVCQATADTGKHRDVVWSVRWTTDDLENYLNFYSVSEVSQHGCIFCQEILIMPRSRREENLKMTLIFSLKSIRRIAKCTHFIELSST